MGSMLNINQLARKENLVIHLDASPSTYTAYPFNSGSQSGTSTSTLTWSNRWTDLSGNNNHAYPINGGGNVSSYNSYGFNLTSSYLNTGIYISSSGVFTRPAFRFNPIIETGSLGEYSISMWLKYKSAGPQEAGVPRQFILGKRDASGASQQYQFSSETSRILAANFWYSPDNTNLFVNSVSALDIGSWYNICAVVRGKVAGSRIEFYLNGRLTQSTTIPANKTLIYVSKQIIIGRNSWDNNQNLGSDFDLSQLLVYNTDLTPQEVWDNYQITKYKHQT
jgi:hypothetical protein